MGTYRIDVEIKGTLRVEAVDSAEAALELASQATPMMSGKVLLGPRIKLSGAALVQNHVLSPQNVAQKHGLKSADPRQGDTRRHDA